MLFKSAKSNYFSFIVLLAVSGLLLASVYQLFAQYDLAEMIFFQIICWVCIILLLWIYFATYYTLTSEFLFYRCGPFTGRIKTALIFEVVTGKIVFVSFKPATGNKGLILRYNRWDDIYISPENKEKFIEELLKLNPNILIRDEKEKI